jgi:hypothetical protein
LLPPEQAFVALGHQHDHDWVGAREMLGLAAWAVALPAALPHRGPCAAVGTEAVALMPSHQRLRHRNRRQLLGRHRPLHHHAAQLGDCDIVAADEFFGRGGRDAHAVHGSPVTQAQKDRSGIGTAFERLIDRE